MKKYNDVPITFRIDQETFEALERQATAEDRDRSHLVRIMIREGLARRQAGEAAQ